MQAIFMFIFITLIHVSHQAEELSLSISYKSGHASPDDVKSVVMNLLPNQVASSVTTSAICECSRMEEVFRRNRLMICGAGMQHKWMVKDVQITANAVWGNNVELLGPQLARLFNDRYWAGGARQPNQWIQVDFIEDMTIYGVVTQGTGKSLNEHVQTYNILYRRDGSSTFDAILNEDNEPQIFQGNREQYDPVINTFPIPITARVFRINVLTFHVHPSIRFDFLIC